MKIINYDKNGGASIFVLLITGLSIMLFLAMIVRSDAAFKDHLITSSLKRHCDLILSEYDDVVYDRYGLFATRAIDIKKNEFHSTVDRFCKTAAFSVVPVERLKGNILYQAIVRFAKLRFPVHLSARFLDWIAVLSNNGNGFIDSTGIEIQELRDDSILSGGTGSGKFDEILDLISLVLADDESKSRDEISWNSSISKEELRTITNEYNDISNDSWTSGFFINNGDPGYDFIGFITEFAGNYLASDPGKLYSRLSFEYYLSEMFSCRVNYIKADDGSTFERNLRGSVISVPPNGDACEIERIIFGCQDEKRNRNLAQALICSSRFAVNMLVNLTDPAKREEIQTAAASISAAIALISAGTAAVPPETIEGILLVIISSSQTLSDWTEMLEGGRIPFIPVPSLEKVEISYKDHLRIMLLCVPKDLKLDRVAETLESVEGESRGLYTRVRSSCSYKGKIYCYEDGYFG